MSKSNDRFAKAVQRAEALHHRVRLMVFVGDPRDGDEVTYATLPGDYADASLPDALDKIEAYLESPTASRRAELVATRDALERRAESWLDRAARAVDDLKAAELELDDHLSLSKAGGDRPATAEEVDAFVQSILALKEDLTRENDAGGRSRPDADAVRPGGRDALGGGDAPDAPGPSADRGVPPRA